MATHSSILAWRIPWTEEPGVHGVAWSWTRLKQLTARAHTDMHGLAPKGHSEQGWTSLQGGGGAAPGPLLRGQGPEACPPAPATPGAHLSSFSQAAQP